MPVDQDTFDKFQHAKVRAKDLGLADIEVMDRAGLLLTTRRRHEIEVQAMEDLYRRLERQDAAKLMRFYHERNDGTAAEMFEALRQWLQLVCVNKAEGTLGEL